MEKISRECLGLAAEYAVASELCRHGMYAQLTLGSRKRVDVLVEVADNAFAKVEVKGKQSDSWPNCKGICGKHTVMVLVDFAGKAKGVRPDFYILTRDDWFSFLKTELKDRISTDEVFINENNVPVWPLQKRYRGCGIKPSQVLAHKEHWEKVIAHS